MEPVIVVGTSTKEKTDQNTNWTLCVICQVPNTNVKYSKSGDIGRNKLSNCVAERLEHGDDKYNDTTTRLKSVNLTTLPEVILYHRKCYGIYTNPDHMKRLKDKVSEIASDATTTATNEPSTPSEKVLRRATRSHIPSLDKNLCIFCQTTKVTTTTSKVMTFDVSNSILKAAKCDFIMSCRLANMTDVVAEDALYHQQCRVEFMRRAVKTDVENKSSARDVCMTRLAAEVRDGVSQGHVYNLVDVWHRFKQIMSELGEDPGSYRNYKTRFKQRLEKELDGTIAFIPQLDNHTPQLLFPKESANAAIPMLKRKHDEMVNSLATQELSHTQPKQDEDSDALMAIHHIAMIIRKEAKSIKSNENCTSISEDDANKCVTRTLYLLLRLILTGREFETDDNGNDVEDNDNSIRRLTLSIGQDISHAISNSRKLTPKHVGLGMAIHQATRSKALVNLVHAAGHCISYTQVRQIDTSIAKLEIETMAANDDVPMPVNIEPGQFVQFAADNIDIIEETLDGKETFHATQMVAFQREGNDSRSTPPVVKTKDTRLHVPDTLHKLIVAPKSSSKPTPVFHADSCIDISWYVANASLNNEAFISDLTWACTRLVNVEHQSVPFWTGFNQIVSPVVAPKKTTVGYLPILNAPAHEDDTLWTVIQRCLKISEKLNHGQSTVITFDEQLYCKAKQLQWNSPDACKTFMVRLGGFHIALNYMRAIGKHMTDSGLPEVWIESSVFGENTAVNNMDAKSYNRTIRAHKLTYEALIRIVWPQFLEWLNKRESPVDPELKDNLESLAIMITGKEDVDDIADMYESVKLQMAESNIADLLHEFQSQRSPTVQYWQQYIDMIAILLAFIRAEREGNWLLHLSAFAAMLPWFAIYDRINYTRWGSVYLADMHQLELTHPDVYTEFRSGNVVVKQTRQKFNQLSTDQALEHVNKVSKMAGGLIGITREDSARDRWCLTFNQRSKVTSDTYEMLGVHNVDDRDEECSVWENKEAHTSRLARDEKDVQHIVQQFERFHVFTQQSACLVCLSTRDVVPEDITSALLNAERHGHEQVSSFVTSRLVEAPCTFHDTLKKNKSPTMATMYDVTVKGSAIEKSKSVKGGRNLFQRLLVAQKAGRVVSLEELMCHELSNTPISISDTSGNLRHCTNKADLCHILDTGVTDDTVPDTHLKTATVIDGHALVQAIGRPSDGTTFGDLADVFINVVNKSAGSRLDVVFDRCNADSIKSGTRTHRAGIRSRAIRRIIDSRDVPLPVNWKRYIDSPENKANLAVFLSNELMSSQLPQSREIVTAGGFSEIDAAKSSTGRDVNHLKADHEEADTRIILHAIDASQQGFERLNIVCKDTDVLVLLIHFADVLCKDVRMKVGSAKAPKYIAVHDIELSDEMRECLPAFHAVSGCDTVSQFSGHGKKSTWKVFEGKPGLLKGLGTGLLSKDFIANVEEFVCRIYSPSGEVKCVNELRCRLFQKGTVEPEKLPPTHDALVQHVKRAHFQTMVWMKASLPYQDMISPIEHGWTRDIDSKTLKPVLTTIDPLPKSCIETISCGCKSCATSRCGCRSKGMRCTPACACYDNVCHNPRNGEADSDNE